MTKLTEKQRREYNRDCDRLEKLRAIYKTAERAFDAKWLDKPIVGKAPWELLGQTFDQWCVEGMKDLRAMVATGKFAETPSQKTPLLERLKLKDASR